MPVARFTVLLILAVLPMVAAAVAWIVGGELYFWARIAFEVHPALVIGILAVGLCFFVQLSSWGSVVYAGLTITAGLAALIGLGAPDWTPSVWQYVMLALLLAALVNAWLQRDYME